MKKYFYLSLALILALLGCSKKYHNPEPSENYMVLNEIQYVEEFPQSYTLGDKEDVGLDIIGMKDFRICDSLLIVSAVDKDGLWEIYSLNSNRCLGKFLKQGIGPGEFIFSPLITDASLFRRKDNSLSAIIYNSVQRKVFDMNITKSLNEGKLVMDELDVVIPEAMFNYVMLDDTYSFVRKLTAGETKQERSLYNGKNESVPSNFELLNRSSVQKRDMDFNILSAITKCNTDKKKILEAPITLNYLNLYSYDSDWGKTICVGNELYNISDVQSQNKWDRIYTYANITPFTDFFGALYFGEDEKTYQMNRTKLPVIYFFDWDGNPLMELKLSEHGTSFDIDLVNGYLYLLDLKTDNFYKYNIKDILEGM